MAFETQSAICDDAASQRIELFFVSIFFGLNLVNSKRAIAQMLQLLSGSGVTHIPHVEFPKAATPDHKSPGGARKSAATSVSGAASSYEPAKPGRRTPKSSAVSELRRPTNSGVRTMADLQVTDEHRPQPLEEVQQVLALDLVSVEQKRDALCSLAAIVAKCQRCTELASGRKQTVFGVGDPDARIMFIGEAPGAEEDAKGEPFVGDAGQLLNKIITACHLKREDIYICNVLRCRPPGNRNPLPQEATNCREFLDAQIQIVNPDYIICWGAVAAQNLLGETRAVGKLRRQFFEHKGAKVMCTYHPSYLLRNPSAKKEVWEDMKLFMKEMGVELQ